MLGFVDGSNTITIQLTEERKYKIYSHCEMILTNDLSIIELAQATGELVLFIYLFIYLFNIFCPNASINSQSLINAQTTNSFTSLSR